jgi:sugar lactone lactonase YvrE
VVVLDALGQLVSSNPSLSQPLGLALDGQGSVYVGDTQTGSVSVFDEAWNLTGQLGQGPGEFQLPGHITTATNGGSVTVYVADSLAHCVKAYRGGVRVGQYGTHGIGPEQFRFPAGLWADAQGTLFVVDQDNDRVQVLDANGQFLRRFLLNPPAGKPGASGRAQGISGDDQGRLYVSDTFQGYVKVFAPSGAFLGIIGSHGQSPFQFRSPCSVATDPQGRLWVADVNNARVDGFCFVQPTITPMSQSVADEAVASFVVDPGCAGSFQYQWLKDSLPLTNGGVIAGATTATLTLNGVTLAEAGQYSVEVGNVSGTVSSSPALLTVLVRPFIITPPADQSAPPGDNVVLSVVAGGHEPLFYQWYQDGVELTGETNRDLMLAHVSEDANGIYEARVTNLVGSVASSARFAVSVAPVLSARGSAAGGMALSWNNPFCVLQSAPTPTGPWQNLSDTSPFTVSAAVIAQTEAEFFRLVWP